jgi:hypothetical protein
MKSFSPTADITESTAKLGKMHEIWIEIMLRSCAQATSVTGVCNNKMFWKNQLATFLLYDIDCTENYMSNNSSLLKGHVYLANDYQLWGRKGEAHIQTFLLYDTDCIENDASKNVSIVVHVFVTEGTCLPTCCLALIKQIYTLTHRQVSCGFRVLGGDTHTDSKATLFSFFITRKVC